MKLLNVNKYFNKNKSNEIHVLNDISIDFPVSGLVAIMGQSGSGKTTLLNALCGLDKINSGVIEVGDTKISRYSSRTWDRLRNQEFGYIFQNYNIFEEKTVFDNVALSLEFLGMHDKDEIKRRVMQSLEMVGMSKYRNRLAGALSGGEMQRVAIARALVKDPTIMIADEPTGNLDEKNTIMIMNILKKIARNRLVILVTHEKEIGEFYADTIIHIRDGKISDITQGSNEELKLYADSTIYLQDLNKEEVKQDKLTIAKYYSEKFDASVTVEVIVEGKDIIINAYSPDKKIKFATNDSNITIVDGKKPQLTKEEIEKNVSSVTEIDSLDKSKLSCKYNIGLFSHIKKGFERVFDLSKFKKLFLLGFVISACLLVLSFSAFFGISQVDEKDFLTYDRDLILIEYKDKNNIDAKYEDIKRLVSEGAIDYYYPNTSNYAHNDLAVIKYFKFNVINSYNDGVTVGASFISYDRIKNYKYVIPQQGEVVIDRFIANKIYDSNINYGNTIQNDELLRLTTLNFGGVDYKIVGISEENNGCVYINPLDQYSFYYSNINKYNGQIAGLASLAKGEVAIVTSSDSYHVGGKIEVFSTQYTIKEVKQDENAISMLYLNSDDIDYEVFKASINESKSILVSSKTSPKTLKKLFATQTVKTVDKKYKIDYKEAANDKMMLAKILLIFAGVTIIAPLIFLFFLMRSNLISRVKEVGVYRALGLSKLSILKMHASEALAISATGTLFGWILGVIIIIKVRLVSLGSMIFTANPALLVGCLLLCIIINLVVGCIPIMVMLRKTPQEILSKYDI